MRKIWVHLIDGPRKGDSYVLSGLELPTLLKIPKNVDGVSGGQIRIGLYRRLPEARGAKRSFKPAYTFIGWADDNL